MEIIKISMKILPRENQIKTLTHSTIHNLHRCRRRTLFFICAFLQGYKCYWIHQVSSKISRLTLAQTDCKCNLIALKKSHLRLWNTSCLLNLVLVVTIWAHGKSIRCHQFSLNAASRVKESFKLIHLWKLISQKKMWENSSSTTTTMIKWENHVEDIKLHIYCRETTRSMFCIIIFYDVINEAFDCISQYLSHEIFHFIDSKSFFFFCIINRINQLSSITNTPRQSHAHKYFLIILPS